MTLPLGLHPDQLIHAGLGLALLIVATSLTLTRKELNAMSEAMTNLTNAVSAVEASSTAVTTAIATLKAQIATLTASGEDPAALAALTERLNTLAAAQTAAVAS